MQQCECRNSRTHRIFFDFFEFAAPIFLNFRTRFLKFATVFEFSRQNLDLKSGTVGTPPPPRGLPEGSRPPTLFTPMTTTIPKIIA